MSAFIVVISKFLSAGLSLLGGVILARSLSTEVYGTYSQITLIATSGMLIANMSLPKALYYYLPRSDQGEMKSVVVQIFIVSTIITLFSSGLLLCSMGWIAGQLNNPFLSGCYFLIPLYMFVLAMADMCEPFFLSLRKLYMVTLMDTLACVWQLIVVIIVVIKGQSILYIVAGIIVAHLLKVIVLLFFMWKLKGSVSLTRLRQGISSKIKYSFPLMFSTVIGVVGKRMDQFIISSMFLPSEYAIYSRGAFELPFVSILPFTLSNILLPKYSERMASNRLDEVTYLFSESARQVALIFFPITVLLYLLSEPFIVFLFSNKFINSYEVFRVYLLMLPLRITVYGTVPRACGRTDVNLRSALLFVLCNVIASILFINLMGSVGAAWGTVFAVFINTVYLLKQNILLLKTDFSKILPWFSLLKIMISSLISGVCVVPVIGSMESNMSALIYGSVLFTAIYVLLGYLIGCFTDDDILFLKKCFYFRKKSLA